MVSNNQNQDHHSYTEKMQRYVEALEVEKGKIQVFQRELPLCLELVTQAIEGCKQQLSGTTTEYFHGGQSECSEQTSSECPVLVQQFIPMKRTSLSNEDEEEDGGEEHQSDDIEEDGKDSDNTKPVKKSDWLRSVQLWNQTPDLPTKLDSPRRVLVTEVKKPSTGAFQPFKKDKSVDPNPATKCEFSPSPVLPTAAASSTAESGGCSGGGVGGDSKKQDKEEGQSQRKSRRCWSPELHRRFLDSLQQLGGSHVATPKQIRELMKVDGLTNDEVKSHLQKYRLHTRRPNHSVHSNNNNQQAAPQFVVVGGIWVPPQEYTAAVATTTSSTGAAGVAAASGIYAPIAAHPPQPPLLQIAPSQPKTKQHKQSKQLHFEESASRYEGGVHNHSPANSTSTHSSPATAAF